MIVKFRTFCSKNAWKEKHLYHGARLLSSADAKMRGLERYSTAHGIQHIANEEKENQR